MKRWTPEAIKQLERYSELSRAGQPVKLDPDLCPGVNRPSSNDLIVTIGKPRKGVQKTNVLSVPLVSESGQALELRVRSRRRPRR